MRSNFLAPDVQLTGPYKEVRFSQTEIPLRRSRSVASSNPLRDSRYSRRRPVGTMFKEDAAEEFAIYVEQSRSLLESQRDNFERERTSFARERQLWEMERSMLKGRIAELEAGQTNGVLREDQTSDGTSPPGHFRTDFAFRGRGRASQSSGTSDGQHHVWEGPVTADVKPTRVFPDEGNQASHKLSPTTEENGFGPAPSLDAALSPDAGAVDRSAEARLPVPIERLDRELDGITLKSTALPPVVVAKVISSSDSSPKSPSGLGTEAPPPNPERRLSLKLKLSELGRPDENLVRDAGHTPMAIIGTEPGTEAGTATQPSHQSPTLPTDTEENPLAPVQTTQPKEDSDSYFPGAADDPSLKGPLTLPPEARENDDFLSELDQKLLQEARKAISGPSTVEREGPEDDDDGEPDIRLKLKGTTNFGSAFGASECGAV